jgi:hypothetical protein
MTEKKVVGRKVAIALGIICVILVVGLAGVMVNYTRIINDKDSLQSQVNSLNAAQLHEVNLKWDFNEPWIGGHYVHVYGAIFNSGTNTAYDVKINVLLYDSSGVLIKSSTIMLGNINGKSYQNIDTNIDYSGHCETYSYQIVHS